jgi:hypothetical protein
MNIKIDNYTFDKTAKTVTFLDYDSISLSRVMGIVNAENNVMFYNCAGTGKGGSVSGNVLTLDYDTSAMANTDKLQIIYDDKDASLLVQLIESIKLLFRVMANPPWVDKSANQMRAQVTGSLTTAGTVSTVTTITNLGGYPAQQGIIDQNRAAWAVLCRGRLA